MAYRCAPSPRNACCRPGAPLVWWTGWRPPGSSGEPTTPPTAAAGASIYAEGEETTVRAARVHVENVRRLFLEPLPDERREQFVEDLRTLSHAPGALPRRR